jgi:hypothetical protein
MFCLFYLNTSQISVVGIVSRLRAAWYGFRIPVFSKDFSPNCPKPVLGPPSLIFIGCRDAFF